MNENELIILSLIIVIISIQLYFSWNTFKSILQLRDVLPDKKNLKTISDSEHSEEIILIAHEDAESKYNKSENGNPGSRKEGDIKYFADHGTSGNILDNILSSINNYLRRNKGAVADFNLIKDITDRNIDALEEEINTMLPVPLYIGLAGTMGGIIIGLLFMPKAGGTTFMAGEGIDILIGGV